MLWRCAEMQDVWQQRGCDPHNETQVVRKRQCRYLRSRGDRSENFPRLLDCLLARKRTVANQNTDVIHAHCAERSSLSRSRNFVDLDDHAANLKIAADYPANMK